MVLKTRQGFYKLFKNIFQIYFQVYSNFSFIIFIYYYSEEKNVQSF